MIPKKPALGLDHRKSDVSDLRKLTMAELGNTRVLLVDTGFRKRSCSTKRLERDDDSKRSHHALSNRKLLIADWPLRPRVAKLAYHYFENREAKD
jgi:hypothetical protein